MRRLLAEAMAYLRHVSRAAHAGWNVFFFSPADPTTLGLMRIAVGLLAFWSLLVFGLDLHDYFGSTGWAAAAIQSGQRRLIWSFWFLVPDGWLRLSWCVSLAVLALYTLGLFSRVTAILAWVIVVSTVRRVPNALYGFDQVISALALYLAVTGASGQAVSVRSILAPVPSGTRRVCAAAWRTGTARDTGRTGHSACDGLGESGSAPDTASPRCHLWNCRRCKASRPIMVERHGILEDDDDRRIRHTQFHGSGGLAVARQSTHARQRSRSSCFILCSFGSRLHVRSCWPVWRCCTLESPLPTLA